MNTNAIFAPTLRMQKALKGTMQTGLTRVEISYYADTFEAQQELFASDFLYTVN